VFVAGPWITWEALARRAYVEATREAVRDGADLPTLRGRFEALRERYFWTATARFDVAPVIAEIESRERAQAAGQR
jgi:hypothetical protein